MDGFEIVVPGRMPQPHPSRTTNTTITELCDRAAYEVARLDAVLQRSAADQTACHWCQSGLYSVPESGCPACGRGTHNGHEYLARRSGLPVIHHGPPSPVLGVR
jgi:hypothetical protein